MTLKKIFITLVITVGITNVAMAGDITAGKEKAASCAGCHGTAGISNNPAWPNLAGQQKNYLEKQLRDFRSGKRQDPLMSPMAKPLSNGDIENLAAYFNSLK